MPKIAINGLIVLVGIFASNQLLSYKPPKDLGCDNVKEWSMPPDIKDTGYVHSSLVPFREWLVDYLDKKNRSSLTLQQCLAVSSFLRVYAWGGEPCRMRSIPEIYKWLDYCITKWSDPDYTGYDGCYIYDIPITTDQNAAFVITRYLLNNPECKIRTPEELRNKINESVIEDAKDILAHPHKTDMSTAPDCEQIRNPSFWTKLKKWPKNPYRIIIAYELAQKARHRAEKLCLGLHNGAGDAFRHCYWTCLLTRELGLPVASDYSDYHEFSEPDPCDETIMDYTNNRLGMQIGLGTSDCEKGCKNNKNLLLIKEGKCF